MNNMLYRIDLLGIYVILFIILLEPIHSFSVADLGDSRLNKVAHMSFSLATSYVIPPGYSDSVL